MKKISLTVIFVLLVNSLLVFGSKTVRGTITHPCLNKGFAGALVKVFDSDTGSGDDFMGQATTNASGRYSVSYTGKHWDPAPHRVTTWRPDIYIKLYIKQNGKWEYVKKSRIYTDHKMKLDLTINLKAEYPSVSSRSAIGSVYGIIKNAHNGQPVHPAKICVEMMPGQTSCIDNKPDGGYILNARSGHCYQLRISAKGYQTKTIVDVSIIPGGFTNIPVSLNPALFKKRTRRGFQQ